MTTKIIQKLLFREGEYWRQINSVNLSWTVPITPHLLLATISGTKFLVERGLNSFLKQKRCELIRGVKDEFFVLQHQI